MSGHVDVRSSLPSERSLRKAASKRMRMVFDQLYGRISFTKKEMEIIRSLEVRAMFRRSQGSIPAHISLTSTPTTTGEHALGTMWLCKLLLDTVPGLRDLCPQLAISGLLHDAGGAPFRHVVDFFMRLYFGYEHEERLSCLVGSGRLREVIERQGYSVEAILADCAGTSLGGTFLDGCLGADTLDNVRRYSYSKGLFAPGWTAQDMGPRVLLPHPTQVDYSPVAIVAAYRLLADGTVCIDEGAVGEVVKYLACRKLMYAHIGGIENRTPESMLRRAIGLAFEKEEIPEAFFAMSDEEAFGFLRNRCNDQTRSLMRRLESARFYHQAFFGYGVEDGQVLPASLAAFLNDPASWMRVADGVADLLGRKRHHVCSYISKGDRGYRKIDLPILVAGGSAAPFPQPYTQRWRYQVELFVRGGLTQEEADMIEAYMGRAMFLGEYS